MLYIFSNDEIVQNLRTKIMAAKQDYNQSTMLNCRNPRVRCFDGVVDALFTLKNLQFSSRCLRTSCGAELKLNNRRLRETYRYLITFRDYTLDKRGWAGIVSPDFSWTYRLVVCNASDRFWGTYFF